MTTLRSYRWYRRFACLLALVPTALAIAVPIASAQTSQGGYAPPSSNVQAEIQDSPASPSSDSSSTTPKAATTVQRSGSTSNSTLPFTGLDLGFIGLAGVGLLLVGFTLRRLTLRAGQAGPRDVA